MRSRSWFGRFWTRLRAGLVQDVPPSLEECETCREVDCTQERWLQCEKRLAAEEASLADNAPGRTDELLPQVFFVPPVATHDPTPAPSAEEADAEARPRKVSSD